MRGDPDKGGAALIIIINGPSGSGKTTLGNYFKTLGLHELVSTTTRPPRNMEVEGVSYYFVTEEEFNKIDMIEQSEYSGNRYGLSRQEVESKLKLGPVFASLDKNGVKRLREIFPAEVIVIYLMVSESQLKSRMFERGDPVENIMKRLKHSKETDEDQNIHLADYVINNNGDLNELYAEGRRILEEAGLI